MASDHSSSFKLDLLATVGAFRSQIRNGEYTGSTSGFCPGLVQGNLVILPADWASDFLLFCQLNPVSCPLIHVSQPGEYLLNKLGDDLDVRTDIPEYQIFENGERTDRVTDIKAHWRDDFVTFVLGCSFSFEDALKRAGIAVRNVENQTNVSMYRTNIETQSAGRFHGRMVVSMRPFAASDAIRSIQITTRLPKAHGAPIHLGDPSQIGIQNIDQPDFGDSTPINQDEIPLFWACGVTPQVALENARPPVAITHVPGKMIVTDLLNEELAVL